MRLALIVLLLLPATFALVQDPRAYYENYELHVEGYDFVFDNHYFWYQGDWHQRTCPGANLADNWVDSCNSKVMLPSGLHYFAIYACDIINNEFICNWVQIDANVTSRPQEINPTSQFAVWKNVGGSLKDDAVRNIRDVQGPNDTEFWDRFLAKWITPYTDQGITRVHLHNPFGTIDNTIEVMQFDQYLDAKETLPGLANTFVSRIKPLTDQNIEVIAYIGGPLNDPDTNALTEPEKWEYAQKVLEPLFEARTSIALDYATEAEEDSFTFRLAQALRDRGIRVYVESRARLGMDHWYDFHQTQFNSRWIHTDPQDPRAHVSAPNKFPTNDVFSGEIVRFFRGSEYDTSNPTEYQKIEEVLNDGHLLAFNWQMWEDVKPYFEQE